VQSIGCESRALNKPGGGVLKEHGFQVRRKRREQRGERREERGERAEERGERREKGGEGRGECSTPPW
jgi:hypothetical protein